jgi:hypothetical protein
MLRHRADPRIFLAFRFHTNFYHSYRGDTPDEFGFGKDIRIIRKIIEVEVFAYPYAIVSRSKTISQL